MLFSETASLSVLSSLPHPDKTLPISLKDMQHKLEKIVGYAREPGEQGGAVSLPQQNYSGQLVVHAVPQVFCILQLKVTL